MYIYGSYRRIKIRGRPTAFLDHSVLYNGAECVRTKLRERLVSGQCLSRLTWYIFDKHAVDIVSFDSVCLFMISTQRTRRIVGYRIYQPRHEARPYFSYTAHVVYVPCRPIACIVLVKNIYRAHYSKTVRMTEIKLKQTVLKRYSWTTLKCFWKCFRIVSGSIA